MSDMSQKPSREIDELIADKVMGLKRKSRIHGTTDEVDIYTANPYFFDSVRKEDLHYVAPLPYSTNIADAWEVVRKMGMVLIENSGEAFGQADEWNVQFVGHDSEGEPHWVSASASTCELAICLAALKAVGA